MIREGMQKAYARYDWEGAYTAAQEKSYRWSCSGIYLCGPAMELGGQPRRHTAYRKHDRRYPERMIPFRALWHNSKVEHSHKSDQCYFYDWKKFSGVEEANEKLGGLNAPVVPTSERAPLFGSYHLTT